MALSGSIQVYKVLGIGISLTEWASRGISTRGKMDKAGRVRPQSGITEARQLGIAVLAPISVLLHDSDTRFPSTKSRSNQKVSHDLRRVAHETPTTLTVSGKREAWRRTQPRQRRGDTIQNEEDSPSREASRHVELGRYGLVQHSFGVLDQLWSTCPVCTCQFFSPEMISLSLYTFPAIGQNLLSNPHTFCSHVVLEKKVR
jgi:hypothetical protein